MKFQRLLTMMKGLLMENIKERIDSIAFNVEGNNVYPDIPNKNLLIEISNKCNNQCIFCANRRMTRKIGDISPDLLHKILLEAYELGVREVGFYTTGEPLINDNLPSYIKMAKNIGFEYIYITTNGLLAKLDKIKSLIDLGLNSIKFSINAINSTDYKFIHANNCFDKVINNLTELYKYKKEFKQDFNIFVSYVATKYTEYDNNIIEQYFRDKCDKAIIVNVRNQSGMVPLIEENLKCVNQSNKIKAERNMPCHYTFKTINISYEGYLTACCTDFQNYLAYADLNETTLKEAWHNSVITDFRKKQITNNIFGTLCDNCINNSLTCPQPLVEKYATKIEDNFFKEDLDLKSRIFELRK